jgi:cytochrome c biogenesis protein CcmG/thiol:disulfide interchange protein DsbE
VSRLAESLLGFAGRVGQLLLAPGRALARIDREGGGLRDALWLVALGTVTFRFPQLSEALLGLTEPASGALMRVVGVAGNEVQQAAWVVLPASVLITLLAGARRDASRDLELGAACYAPYFAVRGVIRAIDAVAGARAWPKLAGELPAALAALVVLVFAVRVARARGGALPTPTAVAPGRGARIGGLVVSAVALVGLGGNVVWAARHFQVLRPMHAGAPAPDFRMPRADGVAGEVSLSALRGQVVVVDFWATWCPPCLAMMPILHDLAGEWSPRGVAFVGVNSDGDISPEFLQTFLREHPMPYPIVLDDGRVNSLYKVRALPQLAVIGRDGNLRATFLGFTGHDAVAHALRDALAAGP